MDVSPSDENVQRDGVSDPKPSQESSSQLDLSLNADLTGSLCSHAASFCSLNSSVMGPPTYRPPDNDPSDTEDVDSRIQEVKWRIESEMKERRHLPPLPPRFPVPIRPPMGPIPMPMIVEEGLEESPTKKSPLPEVVLDPAGGHVLDVASLPWHQRFALTHPFYRNMPYLPPHFPFMARPPMMMPPPPFPHPGIPFYRGARPRFRGAPLVRYIPGGFKDVNRQSSFSPNDFSSELMSYVRMRKEMLKMDLREKIRQRKEELLRNQKAVLEGGGRSRASKADTGGIRPSGKYREPRDRERDVSNGSVAPPPPPKTPREVWQARARRDTKAATKPAKSRSSSESSSSDEESGSRRKCVVDRRKALLAKIKTERPGGDKENEYDKKRVVPTPKAYRTQLERFEGRRKVVENA